VLVGQPELDEQLDSVGLRQLKQRIAVRKQICALDADETRRYIQERLQIAGREPGSSPLFSDEALGEVMRYSRGLPRLINTICENSLLTAYARRLPNITPDIVDYVAKELRLDVVTASVETGIQRHNETDAQRAMSALIELFDALEDVSRAVQSNVRL
jgi:general secretion pathway protein A